jgi:predicted PurR-regulated permease PerM/methylmalonyl-CoA mutase cobalamin-binding subunit
MLTVMGFIAIIAASYFARGLLLPLAMSALVSLLLAPLVGRVERFGLGRGAAVGAVVLSAFLVVVSFCWVVSLQIPELTEKLPSYRKNISEKIVAFGPAGETVRRWTSSFEEMGQEVASSAQGNGRSPVTAVLPEKLVQSAPAGTLGGTLLSILETLGTTLVILILVVFLLIYQSDLRDRMIHLSGHGQVHLTTQAMGEAAENVSRYLLMQFAVNAGYGVVVGLGLVAFGVPNPILWGLVAAIFRFIPYVGPWLGAVFPLFLSLAVFSSWTRPGLLLGSWILLEALTANILEPWLYGERTGISPLAVILAAIFWTWLWGGLGLILSVPLTVTLVVLGKNFPQLSFLSTLLGSESAVAPKMQLYHRLLRRGSDEAADLVDGFQKGKLLIDVYDTLFVPTLALAKTDRFQGTLEDEREAQLLASVKFLAEDLGERRDAPAIPAKPAALSVLCIPAADESDEIIAAMLSKLLSGDGLNVDTLSPVSSVGEKVAQLGKRDVDIVVISALPPGALVPARYLYKKIRNAHPTLDVVVGLWSQGVSAEELQERFGADENTRFATTLAEARNHVTQWVPGLALLKTPAAPEPSLQSAP